MFRKISDYAKVLEEYTRLVIAGPKSLDEMSKMGRRLSLLKASSRERPIEIHSSEEEDLEKDLEVLEEDLEEYSEEDPEEDPEEDSEMLEDYVEEPASEENVAQEEDSVIEDSPKSFSYFEIFRSKKRKRNIVHKRPFRPRSCKKEEDFPFATIVVSEPVRLEFDESEVESVSQKFRTKLRRLG